LSREIVFSRETIEAATVTDSRHD